MTLLEETTTLVWGVEVTV
jgi:hypothetical protein